MKMTRYRIIQVPVGMVSEGQSAVGLPAFYEQVEAETAEEARRIAVAKYGATFTTRGLGDEEYAARPEVASAHTLGM